MARELFETARTKKACLIFFDEIDAIGEARVDDGDGGGNKVQKTMLELIYQLDCFDSRGLKYQGRNEFPTSFIFRCFDIKCLFFCL
jgi:ATP-dependent 26S proteasome regulatory subunit